MAELNETTLISDANLVSYKRFEGNSNDTKNSSYNGSDTSISYGAGYGKFNQGASFPGSAKISFTAISGMNLSSNFSCAMWIKPSSSTFSVIGATSPGQLWLRNTSTTCDLVDAATWGGQGSKWAFGFGIPTGTWGLLVLMHRTSDDKCRLYWKDPVNGVLDSGWVSKSTLWGSGTQSGATFNQLGCLGSEDNPYTGYMDDNAWFNDNLTDEEISLLYADAATFIPKVIII